MSTLPSGESFGEIESDVLPHRRRRPWQERYDDLRASKWWQSLTPEQRGVALADFLQKYLNQPVTDSPQPEPGEKELEGHLCGWAKVDGVWTCLQDYRAVGIRPDTSCGAVQQ